MDIAVPADRRVKLKERKKGDKHLDLGRESDSDTSCNRRARDSHQRCGTETRGLGKKRVCGDHANYNIMLKGY